METITQETTTYPSSLPVIDLNTLTSSEYSTPIEIGDKVELFNNTAVDIASGIITAIKDGLINPLEFAVKKKLIVDALEIAMKDNDVKKILVDEVEKFGKQGATAMGATLKIVERRTYQYANDERWQQLNKSIEGRLAEIKAQEEKIKAAVKNGGAITDQETGEIIANVVPSPVTTSITVSFKKK